MLGWLKALPDEVVRCRPVLSVHYAGTLLLGGELAGVEPRLRDAERWLDQMADPNERPEDPPAAGWSSWTTRNIQGLAGSIAMYRAAIALALGDLADTKRYAGRVLDLVPEDDHLRRGSAAGLLGLAYWASGDLEAGHRSYADCLARLQRVGHRLGHASAARSPWRISGSRKVVSARPRRTYEHALQLCDRAGRAGPAGNGRYVRGHERARPRA